MRNNYFFSFSETKRVRRTLVISFGLAMMLALLLLLGSHVTTRTAHAATTFTVNSTGNADDDSLVDGRCQTSTMGECTLRAAIQQANFTKAADTINFAIPGLGPHAIIPGTDLPPITRPVTIDGYTQSGATPNASTEPDKTNAILMIQLVGGHGGLVLTDSAPNSVIRGLAIVGCNGNPCQSGIHLKGGKGYKIEGNFLGTLVDVTNGSGNWYGVFLDGTSGATIGGTDASDGKVDGVVEARNIISDNSTGVLIENDSLGNRIEGNLIGTDKNGGQLGNFDEGISAIGFADSGISGNRILSNSIFYNGQLGIDLGNYGVTANDPDDPATSKPDPDADTGPNGLQNYPVLTNFPQAFGGFTSINGTLNSTPSRKVRRHHRTKIIRETYIIQFFGSPYDGYGEGKTFLGEVQATTDREGNTPTFGITVLSVKAPKDTYVTATATNKKTGDTSEFSEAKIVKEPEITGP